MNHSRCLINNAQQLMQKLPVPLYIIDLDDQILWVNDCFENKFGAKPIHWPHQLKELIFAEKENVENRLIVTQDGLQYKVSLQLNPILEGNTSVAFTGIIQEYGTNNSMEKDDKYKVVADNTLDTIVLVDNEAIVRYVSPSIQTTLGYTVEQYEGMDAFDMIHPKDRDRVRLSHQQVIQTKASVELEYRIFNSQGTLLYLETKVKPVLDEFSNVKYVVAIVRDNTKRKKTEQLLENILESVNAAVMSGDKDFTQYAFCSESIEKITGIPRKEIIYNPIRIHDHIHPDDNEMLMGETKKTLDMGLPVNKIIRLIHVENEIRWVRMIIHPFLDSKGAIERLDGILLDITEKKRSELAIEENAQRYKSLFKNNLDGVFSIDLKGNFVHANHSFENITGIEINKLSDRCFLGLIFDEDHIPVCEMLSEVMKKREPRDVECRFTRFGQGLRIVNITFVPIFLFGELNGVHGIVKDITDRKREELELIQSQKRYKFLQQSINRFSNDLANVMKVTELENRLVEEVKKVLPVKNVSIEEVYRSEKPTFGNINEIWLKIGEKEEQVFLRIELSKTLLKMEKEWLETAIHYVTILYDNLQLIEDLLNRLEELVSNNETPKWMLRLLFKLSEKERASLSSDLHDSVLQDLIIWYRKLESLRSAALFSEDVKGELFQIEEGLLDAIHQIRITCNELRPPFLLKMGLVESLKSLFSYARMFSNYEIEFSAVESEIDLSEEQILGIYRIVQELLNNASKHSQATKVIMKLGIHNDRVHFCYKDNGVGADISLVGEGSFKHMGLAGIENRILSLEGDIYINSAPHKGFHVDVYIPISKQQEGDYDGNTISG